MPPFEGSALYDWACSCERAIIEGHVQKAILQYAQPASEIIQAQRENDGGVQPQSYVHGRAALTTGRRPASRSVRTDLAGR